MAIETVTPPRDLSAPAEHAANLLNEIASAADQADVLCYHQTVPVDAEAAEVIIGQLRSIICRIGWISELAQTRLGIVPGDMVRGGRAEDWLIPPAYRNAQVELSHG